MTKNLNNHHKELKNAVACVPLKEKNIAQEKSGAMLKNIQKRCKKYVMPIRAKAYYFKVKQMFSCKKESFKLYLPGTWKHCMHLFLFTVV